MDMAPGVTGSPAIARYWPRNGLSDDGLIAYGDFGQASGEHGMARLLERRPDIGRRVRRIGPDGPYGVLDAPCAAPAARSPTTSR